MSFRPYVLTKRNTSTDVVNISGRSCFCHCRLSEGVGALMVWIVSPTAREHWVHCPFRHQHCQNLGAINLKACLSHIQQCFVEISVYVCGDVKAAAAIGGVVFVGAAFSHAKYPNCQSLASKACLGVIAMLKPLMLGSCATGKPWS